MLKQKLISDDSNIEKVNTVVFLYLNGKRYSRWNIVKKVQYSMNISIIVIVDGQNIIHIKEVPDNLTFYKYLQIKVFSKYCKYSCEGICDVGAAIAKQCNCK
jgi:formylmethanofuran dehydrogenase subunit A